MGLPIRREAHPQYSVSAQVDSRRVKDSCQPFENLCSGLCDGKDALDELGGKVRKLSGNFYNCDNLRYRFRDSGSLVIRGWPELNPGGD